MSRYLPVALFLLVSIWGLGQASVPNGSNNDQTVTLPPQLRAPIPPPPLDATLDELEKKGDELRTTKAYADAVDYFRAALKKQPTKQQAAVVWNKLGIAELQMAHFKEARKAFEKSVKLDRSYPEAYNNLGVVRYQQKKYGDAIKNYRRAIALRESGSFHSNLGTAYFAKKDFGNATISYRRALDLDPDIFERKSLAGIAGQISSPEDRAHFSFVIARMYAQMGEFDRAINYLKRAMEEGYKGMDEVFKDDNFAALRKDARFTALMADKPIPIVQE